MLISNRSVASQWGFNLPVSDGHARQRVAAKAARISTIVHSHLAVNCQIQGVLKVMRDRVTREEEQGGELQTVFRNGELTKRQTLSEIRGRLATSR